MNTAKRMRTVLESRRTCATCPEMDNPDSYIRHLQSALKWHDEHVPRPTNPRNTCVVLYGKKPPEEVLFVREDGGGAYMDWFWGGPAYGHHKHYAIKCRMLDCKLHEVGMRDWKDTPAEAIRAWNRRCLEVS